MPPQNGALGVNSALMDETPITELLGRYAHLMDGLAEMYGPHCELSLYSLIEPTRPLLKLVSGRSNAVLGQGLPKELAPRIDELLEKAQPHSTYFSHDALGLPIKTWLQLLHSVEGEPLAVLSSVLHLSAPFHELLAPFMPAPPTLSPPQQVEVSPENFNNNVERLVTLTVERTIEGISADGQLANNLKNKQIVTTLYEKGIFDIKDAIAMVSNKLNISKHTVYLYIRQKKRDDEELSPPHSEIS